MVENKRISPIVLATALRVADIALILLSGLACYYIRYPYREPLPAEWSALIIVTFTAAYVFHFCRLYDPERLIVRPYQARRILLASLTVVLVTLAIGYLTKTSADYSRTWISMWAGSALLLIFLVRAYFGYRLSRWHDKGWLTRRVAIVGAGEQGQLLLNHISAAADSGVSLVGLFDDRRSRVPSQICGIAVRGTVDDLLKLINSEDIDEVIVALPWSAIDRLRDVMTKLRAAPIDVRLCPEGVAYQFPNASYSKAWGVGMLDAYERPLKNWHSVTKRIEDRLFAVLILLFVAPLMLSIAIAIRLETRGPILFRQRRYGFSNELIEVYKFRTLYFDQTDWNDEKQVTKNDPRVSKVGAFLRRSGLDELPQLFNVLKGEMSIVGPRPHPTQTKAGGMLFEDVVLEYFSRHRVKPGITGWAQVNGWKGETDTKEKIQRRVEHDLYYIDRWSVWFDLKIILLTPRAMFSSKYRH